MRQLIAIFALLALATTFLSPQKVAAVNTSPPQCPAGQVPNWDNSACITPGNQVSLGGYGLPAQQNNLPQSGRNAAPAMQRCDNRPSVPLGTPCDPNAIRPSSAVAAASQPLIQVVVVPPGSDAQSAPASMAATDPTSTLTNLLGSWYSGWLQYLADTYSLGPAALTQASAGFLSLQSCVSGQASACEAAIWQQLSPWVSPATTGS